MKKKFENWIHDTWIISPGGAGLLRIVTALYILFFLIPGNGLDHYKYLSELPDQFFMPPPGPMALFQGFPPLLFFQTLLTLLVISLILLTIGYRTKMVSILSGILILLLQGFIYSVGKVNHEILTGIFPILMAFTNWGAAYSVDSCRQNSTDQTAESWPLTLLALLIGFMMFTAGVPKILGGWLDPSTQAVQGHLFNQYFLRGRDALLATRLVHLDQPLFWEFLDWATILFEIGFLAAVWKRSWFRVFLIFAVFFHYSTMLILNIPFIQNLMLYAAFLNWDLLDRVVSERIGALKFVPGESASHWVPVLIIAITAGSFVLIRYLPAGNSFFYNSDLNLQEVILVHGAMVIVLMILAVKIGRIPSRNRR